MQTYHSFEDVEQALHPHVRISELTTGKQITTERTRLFTKHVGNPHESLKIIHVAGTSGKTSTCYFIAELLRVANKKIGLTVSPHIDSIAERVQINGEALGEKEFCQYFSKFYQFVESFNGQVSYFELMMVFEYWVFMKEKVDYAVIETGLGGKHDSSNIASRADKLCVITDIGFDHVRVLGNTLSEITLQKAGIIKKNNTVVMYRQADEVMSVVAGVLASHQAAIVIADEVSDTDYQMRNWNLAYTVYQQLRLRDNLEQLSDDKLAKTRKLQVPGRMEVRQIKDKTVVFDGAHNEQKMSAFTKTLRAKYPGKSVTIMIALKHDKDFQTVIPVVAAITNKVIITTFSVQQDLPYHATRPGVIEAELKKYPDVKTIVIADAIEAYETLLMSAEDILVVTGSFYLISEIRNQTRTM